MLFVLLQMILNAIKAQYVLGSLYFCCSSTERGHYQKPMFSAFFFLEFYSVFYTYSTKSIFISYLYNLTDFHWVKWLVPCVELGLTSSPCSVQGPPVSSVLDMHWSGEMSYPSCSLSGTMNLQLPLNLHHQQHREILLI